MFKVIYQFFDKLEDRVRGVFSHYPIWYGFVAGVGIVLFWRGVWHSVDTLHAYWINYWSGNTIDWVSTPWWDGPITLVVGCVVLLSTGSFVSSFIGNEIIISGLRGEKKLTERTEKEVKSEVSAIAEIKEELKRISKKLDK